MFAYPAFRAELGRVADDRIAEAEVEHGGVDAPILVYPVNGTEIERHAEASEAEAVEVYVANLLIFTLGGVVVLVGLGDILEAFHRHVGHGLS